ncbi:microcin C transport system permease protein [Candidatus Magnetomoraceae bacterium gMMP-1]
MKDVIKIINPITRKRLKRFKEMKRAYFSFWLLVFLYILSMGSELLCNSDPLYIRFNEKNYFPVFKFYPETIFTGSGRQTRPNYKKIERSQEFTNTSGNYMIFPAFRFGPFESIDPKFIDIPKEVTLSLYPSAKVGTRVGTVNIKKDYTIHKSRSFDFFSDNKKEIKGLNLKELWHIPESLQTAIDTRFANQKTPSISFSCTSKTSKKTEISLSTFSPRKTSPKTVRLTFREIESENQKTESIIFDKFLNLKNQSNLWEKINESEKKILINKIKTRFKKLVNPYNILINQKQYTAEFEKDDIRFPFRPVKGHPLGIDSSGRDVFARILYGLRTSMTFGIVLVVLSMFLGIVFGALQGYYGGLADITGQRLTEIWSALPFLYIMILMGSVYGRSFSLLLFCYGIFNWIGISYYIRAEFLRLRKQPFVEAAMCMGLSHLKIIFKHILPNALVPVITFFPFSLVGAIGSLAALDYLGFGLPPPTPSLGELLAQAQQYRWAWWLILYSSLALFIVMLLGVFIGEGIRNAYDPKKYTRLE